MRFLDSQYFAPRLLDTHEAESAWLRFSDIYGIFGDLTVVNDLLCCMWYAAILAQELPKLLSPSETIAVQCVNTMRGPQRRAGGVRNTQLYSTGVSRADDCVRQG